MEGALSLSPHLRGAARVAGGCARSKPPVTRGRRSAGLQKRFYSVRVRVSASSVVIMRILVVWILPVAVVSSRRRCQVGTGNHSLSPGLNFAADFCFCNSFGQHLIFFDVMPGFATFLFLRLLLSKACRMNGGSGSSSSEPVGIAELRRTELGCL